MNRIKNFPFPSRGLIILTAICVAFSNSQVRADEKEAAKPAPDWRAIFQVHYADRVKLFREQNLIFQNVILVGDSITEGFEVQKYFPGRKILNRGIGADVIGNDLKPDDKRGVLKRLDESFFNVPATDAFLLIGINDLGDNHTPETMEAGYREILEQVKRQEPRLKVHVQSLMPTRGNYAKHNANVNDFNERLKKLAQEFGYDYIDLHSPLKDEKGELKEELTADGLHINDAGYKIWKSEIEKKMGWQ
ncbi:MAG TPA: GDSL-type esterase/lipase family protein [Lacipirellulaceae bacterium]|jgi:lysophospholipase L1-like esterase|nr:GDSL-type esterase/lipase family protein [Lacipirellulaceae bacterium]